MNIVQLKIEIEMMLEIKDAETLRKVYDKLYKSVLRILQNKKYEKDLDKDSGRVLEWEVKRTPMSNIMRCQFPGESHE